MGNYLPDLENDASLRFTKTFGRLKGRSLSNNQKLINFTKRGKISYRKVYFNGKWHKTPIYLRENLFPKFKQNGPAIIEQLDTTIVIHPKDNFFVDDFGNIIIEIYND